MITAEIKINGSLIGYVYAVNKGEILDKDGRYSKEAPCIYEVVYYNIIE